MAVESPKPWGMGPFFQIELLKTDRKTSWATAFPDRRLENWPHTQFWSQCFVIVFPANGTPAPTGRLATPTPILRPISTFRTNAEPKQGNRNNALLFQDASPGDPRAANCLHFSTCVRHPCAGAMRVLLAQGPCEYYSVCQYIIVCVFSLLGENMFTLLDLCVACHPCAGAMLIFSASFQF